MTVRTFVAASVTVAAAVWSSTALPATHKPAAPTTSYVVHAGDGGWWAIAKAHGVTLPQLLAANHAKTTTPVRVGETITLPKGAKAVKHAKPAPKTAKHAAETAPKAG
jgi:LysM repeat protein